MPRRFTLKCRNLADVPFAFRRKLLTAEFLSVNKFITKIFRPPNLLFMPKTSFVNLIGKLSDFNTFRSSRDWGKV